MIERYVFSSKVNDSDDCQVVPADVNGLPRSRELKVSRGAYRTAVVAAMGVAALNDRTPAVAMSRMSRCVAHLSSHYAAQLQAVVGSVSDEARTGLEKLAGRGGQ